MVLQEIIIEGAREHNLKDVALRLPRNALITVTGVSGSGKSSLAFDTIYREGQRRFVESLSTYARQFMGRMDKPRVDRIEGLSPTVSIDQKTANRNPRSTVGTITEIYDHLRLLFARLGTPHCPRCGRAVQALGKDRIVDRVMEHPPGTRIRILAPVVRDRKGEYRKDLAGWRLKGFVRARIDGKEIRLEDAEPLHRYKKHTIELVLDRLRVFPGRRGRIAEAVETALDLTGSLVTVEAEGEERTFSSRLSCPDCDVAAPELEPRLFSFNSPQGSCPRCGGLGHTRRVDPERLVADPNLSVNEGALRTMTRSGYLAYSRLGPESLKKVADHFGFSLDQPWSTLTEMQKNVLLYGSGGEKVRLDFTWKSSNSSLRVKGRDFKPIDGIVPTMEKAWRFSRPAHLEKFMILEVCPACKGARLRPEALAVTFRGRRIDELAALSVAAAAAFFKEVRLEGREAEIGADLLAEIGARLAFLEGVGLGYLTLDRPAATLSGGEAQRVRLATQLGAGLQGVLYVLDEPSIGLHNRDNRRLIEALAALRDRRNTVIVVEHDRDMMLASDHIVDMGPGAGREGGRVVAAGPPRAVAGAAPSPKKGGGSRKGGAPGGDGLGTTARYLRGSLEIPLPAGRRRPAGAALVVRGASLHNLKGITVSFPAGLLTVVTGVSGSGKSTLVAETLVPALKKALAVSERDAPRGSYASLEGADLFERVVEIDQSPIGRTPRSNPATYTGVFGLIREVFARSVEARLRGYDKGRFSFNKKGGRCETCKGSGILEVEMHFLPNVEIPCEDCRGRRYNRETLEVLHRGKSVFDVLSMTVDEALEFFGAHRKISRILETLRDVGLGYITLGQPSTTLSGGEAQRVKLAAELCRPASGRTFYVLDEPTTGLHFEDIRLLLETLQRLVDGGNTMVIVEHNLDVIKVADRVIDLGPEGGDAGGEVVAAGTPEEVAAAPGSLTGAALAPLLGTGRRGPAAWPAVKATKGAQGPGGGGGNAGGEEGAIRVEGARVNNLKSLDATIPHGKLTVITGISGSGKTSLAFDTVFAEGQRRFVESLSTYARRFVARLDKVPVDRIEGLAPAIAIDQRSGGRNPRSTVATSTEVHDFLRVLFARAGRLHCPRCGREIRAMTPGTAAADALRRRPGAGVLVTAPLFRSGFPRETALNRAESLERIAPEMARKGYLRLYVREAGRPEGRLVRVDASRESPRSQGWNPEMVEEIDLVVDRLSLTKDRRGRLADSLEGAFREGRGMALVRDREGGASLFYSSVPGCLECGIFMEDVNPRLFSFNSHQGACPACEGLGVIERLAPERLITEPGKPLLSGAMPGKVGGWLSRRGGFVEAAVGALGVLFGFDPEKPWSRLPSKARRAVLYGEGVPGGTITVTMKRESSSKKREYTFESPWKGIAGKVEEWYRSAERGGWRVRLLGALMERDRCGECRGSRLRPEALAVTVGGANIQEVLSLTIDEAFRFFDGLDLEGRERAVARDALREITNRLGFLRDVGLGYLALDRTSSTLSGGEAQRIRLASQLGNRLAGVIYVLDEPTVGLHQRDVGRLLNTLEELRDLGNTVIVVEHDRGTIMRADHVLDIGPGAGRGGGRVVAAGPPRVLAGDPASLTGRYLSGAARIDPPVTRRRGSGDSLILRGAKRHNLKSLDVAIPLGTFVAVTGVSGSGKSTLVIELLKEGLERSMDPGGRGKAEKGAGRSGRRRAGPGARRALPPDLGGIEGAEKVDKVVVIDQGPIGRSSASNPATYTKVFDHIRAVFAATPEARMRGFGKGRFSFNSGAGRCPACSGRGFEVVEMHFLSDVTITCEVCGGKRFDRETLAVTYRGKTISDVLAMDVSTAREFFGNHRSIERILGILERVGLGYLLLGQSSATLSGGEAQRVKLAAELCRPDTGRTIYLLDEPTTGLHFEDVRGLLGVLQMIVDRGNTVVVVEHNLDVIAAADHVIDLGPEGGTAGGLVVAKGTPEEVALAPGSHTGRFLAAHFQELEKTKGVLAG